VAAGDCAAPSGQPLRMSCQAAGPLGTQAAETVLSRIAGEQPGVIQPRFVGTCTSLGRHGAILQVAHKDDSPMNIRFTGRMAAKVKEAVCKGTVWGLRQEAKKPGSAFLFKGDERSVQSDAPAVVTKP
jgi:NADH:ubiquinone reductase (H+-translocating)